jgi:inorganic pyrophosphatase
VSPVQSAWTIGAPTSCEPLATSSARPLCLAVIRASCRFHWTTRSGVHGSALDLEHLAAALRHDPVHVVGHPREAVIIEVPKGSRNMYEFDQQLGRIRLDRMLVTSTGYPGDYRFVPDTLAEDGDPIDVVVLLDEPTFPGCLIHAPVIAVYWMRDEESPDATLLCVPGDDPRKAHLQELEDVPMHLIAGIWHFFNIDKALEPGKSTESHGWQRSAEAAHALEDAPAQVRQARSRPHRQP